MNFKILTLFPEVFEPYFKTSVIGNGLKKKLWSYELINIRNYSTDKHNKVDDTPFGGGCGMIINPIVLGNAIDNTCDKDTKIYYMSPRGKQFNQYMINNILKKKNIAIICGHYEGIDQRVIDEYNIEEISIGDYVLTGGELPAMVFIDSCVRCINGVLGDFESINNESFGGINVSKYNNLLEYPLYTHPRIWKNREVPKVLLSGHHKNIENWKLSQAETITKNNRPDLWKKYKNS